MAKAVVASGEQERSGAQQGVQHVTGLVTRTGDFLKDVRNEMRKVVTPSREEVRTTTTVVILTVFAFAGFFYVVDSVLDHALRALLHSLGSTQ
jgi:preprotein translocase subunit SecE